MFKIGDRVEVIKQSADLLVGKYLIGWQGVVDDIYKPLNTLFVKFDGFEYDPNELDQDHCVVAENVKKV